MQLPPMVLLEEAQPAEEPSPREDGLVTEAVDWAAAHSLMVRDKGGKFDHCPFALLPTPFPRAAFDGAVALGPIMARLVDGIEGKPLAAAARRGIGRALLASLVVPVDLERRLVVPPDHLLLQQDLLNLDLLAFYMNHQQILIF